MIRDNFSRDTITRLKRVVEETQRFRESSRASRLIDGAKALSQEMLE